MQPEEPPTGAQPPTPPPAPAPVPPPYPKPPQPQHVHFSRAIQPVPEVVPPELQRLHEASLKRYPGLNLSNSEYVISAVRRHPIGVLRIWFFAFVIIAAFAVLIAATWASQSAQGLPTGSEGPVSVIAAAILGVIAVLVMGGAFVATYVYNANRFFLTNESVVQEIQSSLFSKHEQTVSLSNIEDASFKTAGIFATWLNYGTIRLSTEGDETTYVFKYVYRPKEEVAILNNAIEAFKNGRPIALPNQDQPS